MKKNPWLLSLAPLLLVLAVSSSSLPLTAAAVRPPWLILYRLSPAAGQQSPVVKCVGDGVYAANSTYQANLRRAAAALPRLAEEAEASATSVDYYSGHYSYTARDVVVGYWPNRLTASSFCRRRDDVNDTGPSRRCADCIAGAFLEVERACPYRREASYSARNCSLELAEIRVFGPDGIFWDILEQAMASGLVFQAIGFGWLFFLLLQEWRSRKRGSLMNSTPLLSEV